MQIQSDTAANQGRILNKGLRKKTFISSFQVNLPRVFFTTKSSDARATNVYNKCSKYDEATTLNLARSTNKTKKSVESQFAVTTYLAGVDIQL